MVHRDNDSTTIAGYQAPKSNKCTLLSLVNQGVITLSEGRDNFEKQQVSFHEITSKHFKAEEHS